MIFYDDETTLMFMPKTLGNAQNRQPIEAHVSYCFDGDFTVTHAQQHGKEIHPREFENQYSNEIENAIQALLDDDIRTYMPLSLARNM